MTLAITAAFASLLPLAAHGADQDETAAAPTTLGSIVVTATRREEVLQKVPSAVTAISGDEVQDGELRSTKDVAKFVPGTQGWNTESRARPRFFIRGVGSNEATNNVVNPIAIYTDQVYYGNSLFLGSPLFDLKRVEVLRGPQGTLRGRASPSGSLTITTRKPNLSEAGAFINGAYGEGDEWNLMFGVNVPVLAGAGAFRFNDGSLLTIELTNGGLCIDFSVLAARMNETFKVTGGTGRFKNASGTLTLNGTVRPLMFTSSADPQAILLIISGQITGTISGVGNEGDQ